MPVQMRREDSFAFAGDLLLHGTRWARELRDRDRYLALLPVAIALAQPDRVARELAELTPPCFHLEHRLGVCPFGLVHDTDEVKTHNKVCDGWYAAILDRARGDVAAASLAISYVSAGTSSDPVTGLETALAAEVYRDVWTDQQELSATQLVNYFFLGPSAANGLYLHEFGAWAGAATAAAGSGLLVNRWLFDWAKAADNTLNGQLTLRKA